MGNRANVVFVNAAGDEVSPGIYLHWNGGPESVYPFLDELDRRQVRADQCYEAARFAQLIGEYFDHDNATADGPGRQTGLSLGLFNVPADKADDVAKSIARLTDVSDNGLYLVCRERGSNPKRTVRRFAYYYRGRGEPDTIHEATEPAVESERKAAFLHEYRPGIEKAFKEIANGRVPEGN